MINKISIIIPILNEEKYIAKCIESIINCDYDKTKLEVFLVDGGSSDETVDIIKDYQKQYNFLNLLHNKKRFAPMGMNLGINQSSGKYIFIISAHASYVDNYFSLLVRYCESLNADCVGPVLETDIKVKTNISNAIKNVLSDKLGVGSSFRSGVDKITEVDTVPFGCYKREIFDKVGFYDERLIRNQDIELNKRIINNGGKIYLIPDIKCTYYARETFEGLAKNNFANGKWNILTAYFTKTFSSLSLRHFIPLLFVSFLVLTFLFSFIYKVALYGFLAVFVPYFSIILVRSIQIKKDTTIFHQFLAFLILHFSYGFGSVSGILEVIKLYIKGKK